MYNIYFNSGTSNTRIYLVKDFKVVDFLEKNVGSKDSSILGSNIVLLKGLKELYDSILNNNNLSDNNINRVYASGMVTSPFGIKEVSHITVPVSIKRLYDTIYKYYEPDFFKRSIYLIRGVKTIGEDFVANRYNISSINNMRGEEIETFGMLSMVKEDWKEDGVSVFLPGSHTHIVYIKHGSIKDILSTFSGELFYAVSTSTILATSIDSKTDKIDEEMLLMGFQALKEYGINRALYLVNTMKIFSKLDKVEKTSFLEGVIMGGVILAFEKILEDKWMDIKGIAIVGNNKILMKKLNRYIPVNTFQQPEKESFAVKGFLELIRMEELN